MGLIKLRNKLGFSPGSDILPPSLLLCSDSHPPQNGGEPVACWTDQQWELFLRWSLLMFSVYLYTWIFPHVCTNLCVTPVSATWMIAFLRTTKSSRFQVWEAFRRGVGVVVPHLMAGLFRTATQSEQPLVCWVSASTVVTAVPGDQLACLNIRLQFCMWCPWLKARSP